MKDEREKALSYTFRILGKKGYTEREIRGKLHQKNYKKEIREKTIQRLKELGYLNDRKFAQEFIERSLFRRPAGKYLLAKKLQEKGIKAKIVEESLEKFYPEKEEDLAKEAGEKFLPRLNSLPLEKKKARLFSFLSRRGFPSEMCIQITKQMTENRKQRTEKF